MWYSVFSLNKNSKSSLFFWINIVKNVMNLEAFQKSLNFEFINK